MGLDIRKPIGLLFALIAAELIANEGMKLASGQPAASAVNLWCAAAFGLFGSIFLWLGRRSGQNG